MVGICSRYCVHWSWWWSCCGKYSWKRVPCGIAWYNSINSSIISLVLEPTAWPRRRIFDDVCAAGGHATMAPRIISKAPVARVCGGGHRRGRRTRKKRHTHVVLLSRLVLLLSHRATCTDERDTVLRDCVCLSVRRMGMGGLCPERMGNYDPNE